MSEQDRALHVCRYCLTLVYIQRPVDGMPPPCPQCRHRDYDVVVSPDFTYAAQAVNRLLVTNAQ